MFTECSTSEYGDDWGSESETGDDDFRYIPTPDRPRVGKAIPLT